MFKYRLVLSVLMVVLALSMLVACGSTHSQASGSSQATPRNSPG